MLSRDYHYSAYGETTVENNHGAGCTRHRYQHQGVEVGNSYGYQGQRYHAATGLYSMRARWYAPEWGRFLAPDPIGLNGGQNRYQFVDASPILFRDPFGLDPKAAGDDASRGKMGLLDLLMPWHQIGVRRGGSSLAEQLDISRAQRVNQFTRSMAGATIVGSATAVPTIVGASYLAPAAAESAWVGLGGPTILRFLDDGWNRGWVNSLWFNAQNLTNLFLVPAYEGATFGSPTRPGLPKKVELSETVSCDNPGEDMGPDAVKEFRSCRPSRTQKLCNDDGRTYACEGQQKASKQRASVELLVLHCHGHAHALGRASSHGGLMDPHDVIVLGAGISGSSFAHACARAGLEVLVAEKTGTPGGCMHSDRLEGDRYWFEVGAHTCYNSYGAVLAALESKNALDKLLPRAKVPFRLLVGDRICSIASQLNILELLLHAPRIVHSSKEGRTVREYYARLVGNRNYDRVFGPLFAAVPSQRADEFPSDMLFKKRDRRKDLPRSFTLARGLQTLVDVLLEDTNITLALNAEAKEVERHDSGFVVRFSDGSTHTARFVVLAVPPSSGAELVRGSFPAVATALSRIAATPIRSMGVVIPRNATPLKPAAGIIPLDERFYSAVSRDTVPDATYRGFTFHVKPTTTLDDGLELIARVLRVDRAKIERVVERHVVLPSPRLGHREIVREIEHAIEGTPLFVTGNYFGGLAIEDCVLRSNIESTRLLKAAGAAAAA